MFDSALISRQFSDESRRKDTGKGQPPISLCFLDHMFVKPASRRLGAVNQHQALHVGDADYSSVWFVNIKRDSQHGRT